MGGRGQFSEEQQALTSYIFSTVGLVTSYKGDGNVKVILQDNLRSSTPTPTFCNTADATYISISPVNNDEGEIVEFVLDHVYYYKGHYLHKSVDLNEKCGPHYHYWKYVNGSVVRTKHLKSNFFTDLNAEDLYYKEKGEKFVYWYNLIFSSK